MQNSHRNTAHDCQNPFSFQCSTLGPHWGLSPRFPLWADNPGLTMPPPSLQLLDLPVFQVQRLMHILLLLFLWHSINDKYHQVKFTRKQLIHCNEG